MMEAEMKDARRSPALWAVLILGVILSVITLGLVGYAYEYSDPELGRPSLLWGVWDRRTQISLLVCASTALIVDVLIAASMLDSGPTLFFLVFHIFMGIFYLASGLATLIFAARDLNDLYYIDPVHIIFELKPFRTMLASGIVGFLAGISQFVTGAVGRRASSI